MQVCAHFSFNTDPDASACPEQVYDEVAVLFRLHKDLLHEFTYFLPDNSGSQVR